MPAHFFRDGNIWSVAPDGAIDLRSALDPRIYEVNFHPMRGGFYLTEAPAFEVPARLYGATVERATRILETFTDRKATTGALMIGDKGSGKTLLAKVVSLMGIELGLPVLLVSREFDMAAFAGFLQGIQQPCIVFFDEFEKTFSRQEAMLGMFDGAVSSNKLFLMTGNAAGKIDEHLLNRPGRVFYYFNYSGLELKLIQEFVNDNLKNPAHREPAISALSEMHHLNFDSLKAIVEEMNRYDQTLPDAVRYLNIHASDKQTDRQYYKLQLIIKNQVIDDNDLDDFSISNTIEQCPFRGIDTSFRVFGYTNGEKLLTHNQMEEVLEEKGVDTDADGYSFNKAIADAGYKSDTVPVTLNVTTLQDYDEPTGALTFRGENFVAILTPTDNKREAFKKKLAQIKKKKLDARFNQHNDTSTTVPRPQKLQTV